MISKTLMGLAVSSVFAANALTLAPTSSITRAEEIVTEDEEPEACSVFCVGKGASADGHAIIARSGDSGPRTMNMYAKVFKRNELANKVVKSQTGFEYKMPNYSYRYISTPRCQYMNKGLHWEVSGINEKGVAVSATLSCYTRDEALVDGEDFVDTGISEDNIAQIVAATASTARDGVETIGKIMKEHGSCDANTIVIADQNEIWYMEMYTNHHFAAVKMPDDCVCSIGNEFMLEDLAPYGENVITSDGLLDFVTDSDHYIAVFKPDKPETLENLDLFATFARPLTWTDISGKHNTDNCHMRTWVGYYLFAKNNTQDYPWAKKYVSSEKYTPFYKPDRPLGVEDVITYMRDRFHDILNNPKDEDNYEYFRNAYDEGTLRCVGTETAYQIHVIKMHEELPAEIACEEWLCMSSSSFAPFVPITNGASSLSSYYTFVPTDYGFDDRSAETIFKKLNVLADSENSTLEPLQPDENWGIPVQNMWKEYESIWQRQWNQVLESLQGKSLSKSKEVLENLSKRFQEQAIKIAKFTYDDLLMHIANDTKFPDPTRHSKFKPYVEIKDFAEMYGWKYTKKDKMVTLTNGEDNIQIFVNNEYDPSGKPNGTISINGQDPLFAWTNVKNDTSYLDFSNAKLYIGGERKLAPININDLIGSNDLAWIIPVCIVIPLLLIGAVTAVIIKRKKPTKVKTPSIYED